MTSLGQKKVCICRHFGWHWNYMRLFWKTVSQYGAKPFHPSLSRWNHLLCFCITSKKSTTCSTLSLLLSWCMVLGHLVVFSSATTWAVTRHGIFPGKNTGVDCHALLQGIFPTQGSNPGLPHCRQVLYHLRHKGSPCTDVDKVKKWCTEWDCWKDERKRKRVERTHII